MTRRVAPLLALFFAVLFYVVLDAPALLAQTALAVESKSPDQKPPEAAAPADKPDAKVSTLKIPPDDSKRVNAVKPDADSIALGKRTYSSQCAMCHGAAGDGKGDLAEDMKLKLYDYRDPEALKGYTDGDLFYILNKGTEKMPGQGDRMSDTQKWNLVNYIRSFSKKSAATKKESKP
jgi:mono/diheme cytochrome c family protein